PQRLPYRENQFRFLAELFRSVVNKPGTTSPRAMITGDIGTGKTALTRRFGTDISRTARSLKVNLQYQHINCREYRGSLFMILKETKKLEELDKSTQSTLQRNIIRLEHYSSPQLEQILRERIDLSFKEGTVPEALVSFIADIASNNGDARYAIELLWRAGKYADSEESKELTPDHIRTAASSLHPVLRP